MSNSGLSSVNATVAPFAGASASLAGSSGSVPVPLAGQQTYFLRGDGTWVPLLITATATLDFPNTTAGNSSDLTMTLTGAVAVDAVSLGIPTAAIPATGNVFSYQYWVSSADTVTIRFINGNASAAINPGSGVFRATVLKYT